MTSSLYPVPNLPTTTLYDVIALSFPDLPNTTKILHLEFNSLAALNRSLAGLQSLLFLNLSHNRISRLENDTFDWTPQLSTIDLSSNEFTTVPKGFLQNTTAVTVIDFSDNPSLRILHDVALGKYTGVRELHLRSTWLLGVTSDLWTFNPGLEVVDMTGSPGYNFAISDLADLRALRVVRLDGSNANTADESALRAFKFKSTDLQEVYVVW